MTAPSAKQTPAQLAKAIQERHIERVREISRQTFHGNGDQRQVARNEALRRSELQAERELRFLAGNSR